MGDLALLSASVVCQALCPSPQMYDLIFLYLVLRNAMWALNFIAHSATFRADCLTFAK